MAKKVFFFLAIMLILLTASVNVFAAETDALEPEASLTNDKGEIIISSLEEKYSEVFFSEDAQSANELVSIGYSRVFPYEMRHLFVTPVLEDFDVDNPYIMLMYIKVDDTYVPLKDIERESNITEEVCYLETTVDLNYIGANKVNKIRVIVFRKNDVENLILDENLQITNLDITFSRWNIIERTIFTLKQLFN
ncbi:MAG: hypothetical protein ACOYEI_03175 [Acetivibrionales bacterium]|jgi:hypothetical protein